MDTALHKTKLLYIKERTIIGLKYEWLTSTINWPRQHSSHSIGNTLDAGGCV